MITREQNENNKQTGRKRFDWFSERKQMRTSFGWFSERAEQSERNVSSLTSLAFQQSDRLIEQGSFQIRDDSSGKTSKACFDPFNY